MGGRRHVQCASPLVTTHTILWLKSMCDPPLWPSLVAHSHAIPKQAASPIPQELQVSFHSSALSSASSVNQPKAEPPPHSHRSWELLVPIILAFLEKPVSHGIEPLLYRALLILAEEVGMCFWNATDAVGRSDVMASPKWAVFVLLNTNFVHLSNSPSVSQVLTMTLLQSRWLVTILPSAHQVLPPPCSSSPPPHAFHCLLLLQVPQQLSCHWSTLAVRSLKAPLCSMLLNQKGLVSSLLSPWRILFI